MYVGHGGRVPGGYSVTLPAGKYEAGRRPDSDSRPTPTEVTLIYFLLALIASARVGSR